MSSCNRCCDTDVTQPWITQTPAKSLVLTRHQCGPSTLTLTPTNILFVCAGPAPTTNALYVAGIRRTRAACCFAVTPAQTHFVRIMSRLGTRWWARMSCSRHSGKSTPRTLAMSHALTHASECRVGTDNLMHGCKGTDQPDLLVGILDRTARTRNFKTCKNLAAHEIVDRLRVFSLDTTALSNILCVSPCKQLEYQRTCLQELHRASLQIALDQIGSQKFTADHPGTAALLNVNNSS